MGPHWHICGVLLYLWIGTAYSIPEYDYSYSCTNGFRDTINLKSPILYPLESTGILLTNSYPANANCSIFLNPWLNQDSIVISIRRLDVPSACHDKLTITNSYGRSSVFCSYIYDPEERQTVVSNGPMTINFTSGSGFRISSYRGFELIFTGFRKGYTDCDTSLLFNCDNGRCIADSLKCSIHNHCGDRSDVNACDVSAGAIVGYVILSIVLVVAFVATCIVCNSRRKRVVQGTTVLQPPPIRNTAATINQPVYQPAYQPTYQPSPGSYQYVSTAPNTNVPPPPPPYMETAPAYNPNFRY